MRSDVHSACHIRPFTVYCRITAGLFQQRVGARVESFGKPHERDCISAATQNRRYSTSAARSLTGQWRVDKLGVIEVVKRCYRTGRFWFEDVMPRSFNSRLFFAHFEESIAAAAVQSKGL